MRFSESVGIVKPADADWFDPVLNEDSPFYVDPFLAFEDEDPEWVGIHQLVVDFFDTAIELVNAADGNESSAHWAKAMRLLTFPEPLEFALGLSMGSPFGSGTGAEFAERMARALQLIAARDVGKIDYVDLFVLFVNGLGVDRISDIFCNISKSKFVGYTQRVCKEQGIEVSTVQVRHSSWSAVHGRWKDERLLLPMSPVTGAAVLLTPDRFLKDIPRVTASGFWSWAETTENKILRDELNYDLSLSLSQAERNQAGRDLAWERPEIAIRYLEAIADQEHEPYDVANDPDGLVGWYEAGRSGYDPTSALVEPETANDFCEWVGELLGRFKTAVEDTDLWRALWNEGATSFRKEKIVQAVAGSLLRAYCEAANVDLTREADIGRGPVDFKFSAGWSNRALAEVKLMSSSHLSKGASAQLPQYLKGEQVACGYYVCVGFRDEHFTPTRTATVEATCKAIGDGLGKTIKAIFVDARPKASASKL